MPTKCEHLANSLEFIKGTLHRINTGKVKIGVENPKVVTGHVFSAVSDAIHIFAERIDCDLEGVIPEIIDHSRDGFQEHVDDIDDLSEKSYGKALKLLARTPASLTSWKE